MIVEHLIDVHSQDVVKVIEERIGNSERTFHVAQVSGQPGHVLRCNDEIIFAPEDVDGCCDQAKIVR